MKLKFGVPATDLSASSNAEEPGRSIARRRIDHRVEVHERIVLRRVLIERRGALRRVDAPIAGCAHVFRSRVVSAPMSSMNARHVSRLLSSWFPSVFMAWDTRNPCRWADRRAWFRLFEFDKARAIELGLMRRRQAADHCDVVVEADVTNPVVLPQEGASLHQRIRQIRRLTALGECRVEPMILENDDENMPHWSRRPAGLR